MDELRPVWTFATSLAIGLLIGLERERHEHAQAGLRTFALVALLGTASAFLSQHFESPWILAAGLLGLAAVMVGAYWNKGADEPGTTTTVALLLCYVLGAMLWHGHGTLAVSVALATTALLYFKAELQGATRRLTRQDLVSFLQFAAISFVILPLLPDREFGPYDALNPRKIWLLVVLISGVSLAGYATMRIAGERLGALLTGALGGLASSTATTLVFARHVRSKAVPEQIAAIVVLLANLTVLLRLTVFAAAVAPSSLRVLGPILGAGALAGAALPVIEWWKLKTRARVPLDIRNPAELRIALTFGALFAAILFITAWLNDIAGAAGVYAVAAVSGLTDVDAITLSVLRLFRMGQVDAGNVATAVVIAYTANLVFKLGLVWAIGGERLAARVGPGFGAVTAGLLAAWWIAA